MRCFAVHVIKCERYRRSYYYAQLHGQKWSRFKCFMPLILHPPTFRWTQNYSQHPFSFFCVRLPVKAHTLDAGFVLLKLIYLLSFSPQSHTLFSLFSLTCFHFFFFPSITFSTDSVYGKKKTSNIMLDNFVLLHLMQSFIGCETSISNCFFYIFQRK